MNRARRLAISRGRDRGGRDGGGLRVARPLSNDMIIIITIQLLEFNTVVVVVLLLIIIIITIIILMINNYHY